MNACINVMSIFLVHLKKTKTSVLLWLYMCKLCLVKQVESVCLTLKSKYNCWCGFVQIISMFQKQTYFYVSRGTTGKTRQWESISLVQWLSKHLKCNQDALVLKSFSNYFLASDNFFWWKCFFPFHLEIILGNLY